MIKAQVHFLAGKGGVGKSVISQALAQYFAQIGHKTLRLSLSEEESALGMQAATPSLERENLWHLVIHPDQALFEYLSLKIHSPSVLKLLLSKNLFRALCSAMPGLADLTRLGKIWYHADPHAFGTKRPIFDKIVVDFPSSGFVKRFLSVARIAAEAVRFGPLAKEASQMAQYFKEKSNAVLHLITLPEELSITEVHELYKEMLDSKDIQFGALFVNRLFRLSFDEAGPMPKNVAEMTTFFKTRSKAQMEELERLKALDLNLPLIIIDEQMGACDNSLILEQIRQELSQ